MAQTPLELATNLNSVAEFTNFGSGIYFSALGRVDDVSVGNELWKVDSSGEVSLVKDVAEGPINSAPDQLTPIGAQLFFVGWSRVWARKYRDAEMVRRLLTDPHSPSRYRANGPVMNIDAFYDAFELKEGDKLYKPKSERIKIW